MPSSKSTKKMTKKRRATRVKPIRKKKGVRTAKSITPSTGLSTDARSFIRTFVQELAENNATIFAGAGLSAPKGYVNWKELLRTIAEDLDLDVDRETNLIAVAQFHVNERKTRSEINRKILNEFSAVHGVTENHEILARLPISTYWTTNYDHLIETALRSAGKTPDVKHSVNQLRQTRLGRDAIVYKMHGDADHPDDAIITKDDYEGYFRQHELFVTKLSGDLVEKTFLFLGFSFSDPNIDYIMSRVRVTLKQSPKQHYCILRREQRTPREKLDQFEYRKRQQSYFVKDLSRIGIQALMVDEYKEITQILAALENAYKSKTIFVSGSAHEYGPWDMDTAGHFLSDLSRRLIESRRSVVTGFGIGVGPQVISGALEAIKSHPRKHKESQLIARPFPTAISDPIVRRDTYRAHRENVISSAGISIFLFGNKKVGAKILSADGVIDEFHCARRLGCIPIPVGATGFASKFLWDDAMRNFSSYYPKASSSFRDSFAKLGNSRASPAYLLRHVLNCVSELSLV